MDYTIIGGQVNITARLEKAADRNSILISETTYTHVRGIVRVDDKQRISVKGVHFPVGAYRVLGVKDSREMASDLLDRDNTGFTLQPIVYDADVDTETYRDGLMSVLEEALDILKKRRTL